MRSYPLTILKGTAATIVGVSVGFALVNFSTRSLVVIGVGGLLPVFLILPTKFLLAYLIGFPLLDQLAPFFSSGLFGLNFGPQVLFRGGLVLLLVLYWLVNQRNPLSFKPTFPILAFLILLTLSSLSSGIKVGLAISGLAKLAFWMLLLLTVADMVAQKRMNLEIIYRCVMFSLLVFIASSLIGHFLIRIGLVPFKPAYGIGEVTGFLGAHNISISLSLGLVVVLASAIKQKSKFLLVLLICFSALIALSILRTYARTGYTASITVLLMLILMVWLYGEQKDSRRQRLVLVAALIIGIGTAIAYTSMHTESFGKKFEDFRYDDDLGIDRFGSGRITVYKMALSKYWKYDIFRRILGAGFGARFVSFGYVDCGMHNDYLGILLSGGLIGIGLYFWLFIVLWRQVKPTLQSSNYWPFIIASTALVAYLVAAMTNGVMDSASPTTYLSFLVGGAMGYYRAETAEV